MKNLISILLILLIFNTTGCNQAGDNKPGKINAEEIGDADSLKEITERIIIDFPLTEEEVMKQLGKRFSGFTDAQKLYYEQKGWLECKNINGEKRYFNRAVSNLSLLRGFYEQKDIRNRAIAEDQRMIFRSQHTKQIYKESHGKSTPVVPVKIKITYTITVEPDAAPDGETIRCWIPWPKENNPRQKFIEVISTSMPEYQISPDSAIHRSVYMEMKSKKGTASLFQVAYIYESSGQYFNPDGIKAMPYDTNSTLYREYTKQQRPHINFSENVRILADSLTMPGDSPVAIVQKIYSWFKENIPWTGALEYSIMPDIPEYVYKNRRGDCGMQTFLFISMLRYKGIPVKWQSGWMVPPGAENLHDWCEVYFEGTGWVPVDVSYDLQESDIKEVKEFYLSGIDSYRLIVNDGISGQLYPPKKFMRSEPYDFQRGEVEWKGGNLYFDKWDYDMKIEYIK
jgi:transglutaminase-like putative cysteine protease